MDNISISALRIMAHVGIHEWEQRILQPLLLDVHLPIDLASCQNQLSNTIDYAKLCECIISFVESTPFTLIETVAEKVAQLIKNEFHVTQLTITVSKPHAVPQAGNVCVTIHR